MHCALLCCRKQLGIHINTVRHRMAPLRFVQTSVLLVAVAVMLVLLDCSDGGDASWCYWIAVVVVVVVLLCVYVDRSLVVACAGS